MTTTISESVPLVVRGSEVIIGPLPTEPEKLQEDVLRATSYKPKGYEHTPQYKRGWDGRVRLMKHSKLPLGLLPRFLKILDAYQVPYAIDRPPGVAKPSILRLESSFKLRPYQRRAMKAAYRGERGVIRAPTGSGKTAIGAELIAQTQMHAVVIVPTIDLLLQYKKVLQENLRCTGDRAYAPRIGQLGAGVVDPQPITVATIRTMAKALKVGYESYEYAEYDDKDDTDLSPRQLREWVEQIGLVIVDECHILGADAVYDVTRKIPAQRVIGMSASPWRDDGADLKIEAATGPVLYKVGTKELVDAGYLVAPVITTIDTRSWWTPAAWGKRCRRCDTTAEHTARECTNCGYNEFRSEYGEAHKKEIVENPVRNMMLADIIQDLDMPTLVLVKQVKHGRLLQQQLPSAVFLSGRDKGVDRAAVYEQVRQGQVQTLICTTIADMGLDLPALGALVLADGGKSSTRHLQRIGRIVRSAPGKSGALVVDLDDSHAHAWFKRAFDARRKIEHAEWDGTALWL